MAAITVFMFVFSLILRASFSLPISLDVKTVHLLDNESPIAQKTSTINSATVFNLAEETKLVQSLTTETVVSAFESVEADHGMRAKRDIFNPLAQCPGDTIPYGYRCLTPEEYAGNIDLLDVFDDYVLENKID